MKKLKKILFVLSFVALCSNGNSVTQIIPELPVQPNYKIWNKVAVGMRVSEVYKLLKKPMIAFPRSSMASGNFKQANIWIYGSIVKPTIATPSMFFQINFKNGIVNKVQTPFGGVPLSKDGKPTTPKIIIPCDNFTLSNPSIIDFRWFPSSGKYPMRYLLQIDTPASKGKWNTRVFGEDPYPITIPYKMSSVGWQNFRWRVKAINHLGESEWTTFRQTLGNPSTTSIRDKINKRNRKIFKYLHDGQSHVALSQLKNEIRDGRYYLAFCNQMAGMIYFYYKNQNDTALLYFKRAIELNPKYVYPYTNSGWIYLLNNNYKQALINFKKALELEPSSGGGYFKVGVGYYYQKEYKKASVYFQKGIKVDPKFFYNILYKYFTNSMQGTPSTQELLSFFKKNPTTSDSSLIDMFAGKITEDAFLKLSNEKVKNWPATNKKRYIAGEYFHIGMRNLLAGNKKEAKTCFEKTVKGTQGAMSMNRILAKKELQSLCENP